MGRRYGGRESERSCQGTGARHNRHTLTACTKGSKNKQCFESTRGAGCCHVYNQLKATVLATFLQNFEVLFSPEFPTPHTTLDVLTSASPLSSLLCTEARVKQKGKSPPGVEVVVTQEGQGSITWEDRRSSGVMFNITLYAGGRMWEWG